MTALIYGAWHQVKVTLRTPRRLNVLLVLMLAIALSGVGLAIQAAPHAVLYNNGRIPVIAPIESEVCLGEAIHYPIITEIDEREIPGRLEVDEAWCLAGLGGACKSALPPNPRLPLLEPKRIVTDRTSRTMPETVTPGVWHFWHTATDTRGQVNGYIVAPITVIDCPAP
jgi:hypothetical protein